jgi:hypothetical protein
LPFRDRKGTVKKSASEYHLQRRGNCAQSVAHAWVSKNPCSENSVEAFAGCGRGQAPGGLCGALYASCELAGGAVADAIKQTFAEKSGGHLTCREIRAARMLSCNDCVGLGAELLEKHAAGMRALEE